MTTWDRLARFPLAALPTPLTRARRLEARLGGTCPPILVKRDDLTGFAAAGHKARQLEFLVGGALAANCDVLVTGGGPSSNWSPAAAVAAAVAGLDCELVVFGSRPDRTHPNLAAALAGGAHLSFTGDPDRDHLEPAILERAAELRAAGRRPFPIPRGGATALGAVGMVLAAQELAQQLDGLALEAEAVVMATGSGGAYAGLAVGANLFGRGWKVVGASVSRPLDEASAQVRRLADASAALLGLAPPGPATLRLVDVRGPGFGVPSAEGEGGARVAFHSEGLLLDPVYTAKAFALLLELVDEAEGPLVFWHTGGLLAAADHLVRAVEVGSPA
jgi:1-aminocyclopropane-1-carboxylate deaminase/D-cysteine desulfhydrase-like pyridoxal-dependent ACC family enzyme